MKRAFLGHTGTSRQERGEGGLLMDLRGSFLGTRRSLVGLGASGKPGRDRSRGQASSLGRAGCKALLVTLGNHTLHRRQW